MMKKLLSSILALLVFAATASALSAAVVVTTDWVEGQPVKILKITWTSDATGDSVDALGEAVNGKVFAIQTDPSGVAALVPDADYDIYIKNTSAPTLDFFTTTTLVDRSATATEMVLQANVPIYTPVTFSVDAAGDVTEGDCWLYIEVPRH